MMKHTLYLFFVLALVAQICAIPDDKADAEHKAKELAKKAVAEGKEKAGAAAAKVEEVAKGGAKEAEKAAHASADEVKKAGKAAEGIAHGGKDCHKPGEGKPHHNFGHPLSKEVKELEDVGKKIADASVKGVLRLFGL